MASVLPDMAAVEALPATGRPASELASVDYLDEKLSDTKEKLDLGVVDVLDEIGEVCEDIRPIDMDENGQERPIVTADDWSTRLISLQDDPSLPVWTFRLWFLSIGLSAFGAVLAEIFVNSPLQEPFISRSESLCLASIVVLAEVIPGPGHKWLKTSDTAFWRFMNPGPFNIKENVGILIMSAAATHGALAINIFAAGSQLLGYGLAGMMRSFLVYPTYCVFPNLIPTIQMFDVLFRNQDSILQRKRVKFFWVLFVGIFIWEWFPEYIAPTLTGVSIFCLARQKSPWVSRIFGGASGNEGLGLFSLCFDWYVPWDFRSGGSAYGALFQPLATQLSLFAGVLICILSFIGAYATNSWKAQNFPFLSQLLFYENGTIYEQDLILNDDFTLNRDKLAEQGLPWFAASYAISKVGSSLSFGATITHMALWNGKQVWDAVRTAKRGDCEDAHYVKMKVYKEVRTLQYTAMFVVSLAIGMATNYTAVSLPWAFFISIVFAALFLPIISTLYAVLCFVPGTEDVARMLGAGLLPGRPQANMYFTLYAYNSTEQGRSMTRDLKMGQYTKLPPRVTFTMQCLALLNYVLMKQIVSSHRAILESVQGTNTWSGATVQSTYGIIPLSIFIGLFIPLPFYFLHRYFPKAQFNHVITPMITAQIGYLSGGINSSVFMTLLVCLFSQYYLRKYRPGFFRKYNFIMSAALDGGTEVMTFVYSFAVGGAGGKTVAMPFWALNPPGNPDYCMRLT
ncbi:OPT oligopeptide transporter [Roridomyces roridus]|uniref:OPT oligopeptide transporter n=1 Tax=Roridomyces roridus TaxID=1738132 RepID=A0AAD7BV20_9AGAR|nr:OPT oligopeptide transporter [Roridomyces roridus]